MNLAKWRRRFIKTLRVYPFAFLGVAGIIYLLGRFGLLDALGFSGGFSGDLNAEGGAFFSERVLTYLAYFLIVGVPVLAIIAFIIIGQASDAELRNKNRNQERFAYSDAFEIPSEIMHGYKLALLTGREPMLTGLTGDTYASDASATCTVDAEHIPPVTNCECGFYAYKDRTDAVIERSINPGTFLLDVELYGIGFVYQRGYRAETQVVEKLTVPKRCMRCKVLPAKIFVPVFHLGRSDYTWWQWQVRCVVCSSSFKDSDKLNFDQMAQMLKISISLA